MLCVSSVLPPADGSRRNLWSPIGCHEHARAVDLRRHRHPARGDALGLPAAARRHVHQPLSEALRAQPGLRRPRQDMGLEELLASLRRTRR